MEHSLNRVHRRSISYFIGKCDSVKPRRRMRSIL